MTVAGQNAVSYGWDSANRLTGITQDRVLVGFYDNANRRTSLTLPNGVAVAYAYDGDSQVIGLTYTASHLQLRCQRARDGEGRELNSDWNADGGERQHLQRRQCDDRVQWHSAELRRQWQPDRRWDQHLHLGCAQPSERHQRRGQRRISYTILSGAV